MRATATAHRSTSARSSSTPASSSDRKPIAEALRSAKALRVYVCNVMTQPNESDRYSAQEHLSALIEHAGLIVRSEADRGSAALGEGAARLRLQRHDAAE